MKYEPCLPQRLQLEGSPSTTPRRIHFSTLHSFLSTGACEIEQTNLILPTIIRRATWAHTHTHVAGHAGDDCHVATHVIPPRVHRRRDPVERCKLALKLIVRAGTLIEVAVRVGAITGIRLQGRDAPLLGGKSIMTHNPLAGP
jgi:hypothetical protein